MKESIEDQIKNKINLIIKMEEVAKELGGSPTWMDDIKLIKESIINLLKEKYNDL